MSNFDHGVESYGVPVLPYGIPIGGKHYFVRPASGSDGHNGKTIQQALDTVSKGEDLCVTGKNDVVHLIGDGGTTGTAREDTAITWDKSSTHLIGEGAAVMYSQRSRIAPTSTTVGAAANKDYLTVSGSGNVFANFQLWAGFATGIANTNALTVSGDRNRFYRCHIVGHADAVSAADAGSSSLALSGSENLFEECVFGTDTVMRSAANATIQFSGGAARNVFKRCIFPVWTSATTSLIGNVAAANPNGIDRETIFEDCYFINVPNVTSAATMAAAFTAVANAVNGVILLRNCLRIGITDWGTDATSLARIFVLGDAGVAATAGFVGDDIGRAMVAIASA